ncbi:MAG: murein L,D-transpeptidase catalytic domain family protein [Dysgonomonas sp.]|nr:murein L,D-transpeptidase catalytic domain family protein [Dysgonomonas sp.]
MTKHTRLIFIAAFLFSSLSFATSCKANDKQEKEKEEAVAKENTEKELTLERLKTKADSALLYSKAKGFSTKYCILIDFSIHSGKKRFFVWDFENDTIKYSSLCCHGYGQNSTTTKPVFSNVEGSYCSSLGKYKVDTRSYSSWGINVHYKMYGQEKTNSNAFKRIIVMHSHTPIPEHEIFPRHLPLGYSQGCPVISDETMRKVDALMKEIKKPVLMWIYI